MDFKKQDESKKRGRPIKHSYFNADKEILRKMTQTNSDRSNYNSYYFAEGLELLWDSEAWTVKENIFKHIIVNENKVKKTIITQIGILKFKYNIETAIDVARHICTERMTTDKALNYIRHIKQNKPNSDRVEIVTQKLLNVLNNEVLDYDQLKEINEKFSNIISKHTESYNA